MKSVLTYTVLRLLILLSFLAVGYLVGLRGIVLLLVSVLTSGIVSLFVLSRNRDQVSTSISGLFDQPNVIHPLASIGWRGGETSPSLYKTTKDSIVLPSKHQETDTLHRSGFQGFLS